ncbi:hypothetical protein WJX72_010760 [[Myrmecia] bisecta]|uniref:Uncharacterized protein n=1 Tax=[Myrmecia] bisecta TaxID=41462 RepID=A0AAW1PKP6_9CHLO
MDTAHGLLLTRGAWRWDARQPQLFRLHGYLQFHNTTNKREIFIPEVTASIILLSRGSLDSIQATVKVTPHHDQGNSYPAADSRPRQDGYWSGYILKAECFTVIEVTVLAWQTG